MLEVLGSADVAPGLVEDRHVEARVQVQRYLGLHVLWFEWM